MRLCHVGGRSNVSVVLDLPRYENASLVVNLAVETQFADRVAVQFVYPQFGGTGLASLPTVTQHDATVGRSVVRPAEVANALLYGCLTLPDKILNGALRFPLPPLSEAVGALTSWNKQMHQQVCGLGENPRAYIRHAHS